MSLHLRKAAPKSNRNVRPEMEVLEDRTVPASVSVRGTRMTILGDNLRDRVTIRDNGNGRVAAIIANSVGASSAVGTRIESIVVRTRGQNDRSLTPAPAPQPPPHRWKSIPAGNDLLAATFDGGVPSVSRRP
jgi:hypothetical protein